MVSLQSSGWRWAATFGHEWTRASRGRRPAIHPWPLGLSSVALWLRAIPLTPRSPFALVAALVVLTAPLYASEPSMRELRIIAPAAPGGGWDQTARAMQQALQRAGLVRSRPVENIPGAAGTIGLARFIGAERGNGDAVMVSGLIMLGGIVTQRSPVTLADVVADRATHGRIRGDRGAGRVAVPLAARSPRRLQGAARVDLVGRRIGGRQRSDPRRARRGCGRRDAAAHQLHRLLGRRRIALGDSRRAGLGRAQRPGGIRAADRRGHAARARASRAPSGCPASTCRRCASRAWTWSSRTGARSSRRPASAPPDRERLEATVERDGRARAVARGARRATAGSIAIWPATRSRGSSTAEEPRVRGHPARSSARAATTTSRALSSVAVPDRSSSPALVG